MKVSVHYLFSKNKKIGSRLISWGTSYLEPKIKNVPSHVAVLVNNKWVFESTLESGVRRISYEKWLEINEEVEKIECTQERELGEVLDYFRSIKDKKYDYQGILYFSWRILLFITLKIKMPTKNRFNRKNSYFCSEVVGKMTGVDCQMTAPVSLSVKIVSESNLF